MPYKRCVNLFLLAIVLFIGGNYAFWKMFTEQLLTDTVYAGGDLARLGYIMGSKDFRTNSVDLPRRHTHIKDYKGGTADIITLGDSFSNGGGGGKNSFYQDYIATAKNFTVLNLYRYKDLDTISTTALLANSGVLDRFRPRYFLLSIAERGVSDLAGPIDFGTSMSEAELEKLKTVDNYARPTLKFINDGNMKFILYNLLYPFNDHALFGEVYKMKLSRELFSVKDGSTLLCFRYKKFVDRETVRRINNNLNTLSDLLAKKGIKLLFMPCVDKYTLYADFIVNNRYPRSSFFEDLRPLPKRYQYIDTKAILLEELKKGEKDIYYADDTHWSWKASEKIFKNDLFL